MNTTPTEERTLAHTTLADCPACRGVERMMLGRLGAMLWVRCRHCGAVYGHEDPEENPGRQAAPRRAAPGPNEVQAEGEAQT